MVTSKLTELASLTHQTTSRECNIMFFVDRGSFLALEFQVLLNVRVHVSDAKIQTHHHKTQPATPLNIQKSS